jgi:short-subunit dehydrogenase
MAIQELEGKVIVVTGASSGFGKGAAQRFAGAGALLGLAARRSELLQNLADDIGAVPGQVIPVQTDVSKAEEVQRLMSSVLDEFGRVDIWINNAGAGAIGHFEEIPLEDHKQVIETDLLGTIYGSYCAMKHFVNQRSGILINVSSVVGVLPAPYYSSYVAAKHGVKGLSAALRVELKERALNSIRVCTIYPASTDTPFFEHASNYSGHEYKATPPVYEPEEVVDAIVNCASNPEDEIPVGVSTSAAMLAYRIAPGLMESIFGQKTHNKLMRESPPQSKDSGSLRQPADDVAGVKGSKSPL